MAKYPNFTFKQDWPECFDCGQKIAEEILGIYPDTTICMDCIKEE